MQGCTSMALDEFRHNSLALQLPEQQGISKPKSTSQAKPKKQNPKRSKKITRTSNSTPSTK